MSRWVLRGRSHEIARLLSVLTRAAALGEGSTVLVAGEPGIGKTALLAGLQQEALRQQFAVGSAKADEVSQIAPGAPLLRALTSGLDPLLGDEELRSLVALQDKPLWLVEAIADLLESRSQRGPLLVVIDDLQWADRLSRFAVRTLSGRLASSPVVWAVAARGRGHEAFTDFDPVDDLARTPVELLDLAPLNDEDVLAVAADILGKTPMGRTEAWLRMVGGNPLLAVQLAEGIAREQDSADHGDGDADTLPRSLANDLRERTRLLDDDLREALHLAAVWGRPLDLLDAARMLAVAPSELARPMSQAITLGLVTEPGDPLVFRHDLVRELVLDDLSESDRARLHGICAAYLVGAGQSALDAAPHARVAARRGDEGSVRILRDAARACVESLPRTAAELIMDAFAGTRVDDPRWLEVGEEAAQLLVESQQGADAVGVIDRLLDQIDEVEPRARLQVLAARALWLTGSVEALAARVQNELDASAVAGRLKARLEACGALALSRLGNGPQATTAAQRALRRGRELHDRETELLALQALGEVAKNEGRHLDAHALFHQLRTSFEPGFLADEITSLQFIDRFDDAQLLLAQASRGREQDTTADLPSLVSAQLWQDFKLASFDAAEADAQTLLAIGDELGNHVHRLDARVVMSTIAAIHGDLPRARAVIAQAELELSRKDFVEAQGLILARARIAALEQDFDEGVRLLKPLMASDTTLRTYRPRLLDQMRLSAGIALLAGDKAFARETVERAASAAGRNPGVSSFEGVALQVRGFVSGDVTSLARAVELLRRSPRPMMLAAALTDHGEALLRTGQRDRAARRLREASDIFEAHRAVPALAHVTALLDTVPTDARARRQRRTRSTSGVGSLTDAETRVARLVSEGGTNRSVGEVLGISTNTVAAHLRSIFLKMGVRSRVQLVNAVRTPEESG